VLTARGRTVQRDAAQPLAVNEGELPDEFFEGHVCHVVTSYRSSRHR
jgi:hypothetical protein